MEWAEFSYSKYYHETIRDRICAEDYDLNFYEDYNCGYTIFQIETETENE